MWLYIVLAIIVVLFAVLFGLFVISKNKFQVTTIKINEAEENVGQLLKDKYDKLLEIGILVKKKTKDNPFSELEELKIDELNHFELNSKLSKYDNNILELSEFNKDIEYSNNDLKVFDDLNAINVQSLAVMKYYNDNVEEYNKLLKKFPSNIIAKLKGYKEKELYTNKKEEMFEILKK